MYVHAITCSMRALTGTIDNEVYKTKFLSSWGQISSLKKPVIAAVSGYAVREYPLLAQFATEQTNSSVAAANSL